MVSLSNGLYNCWAVGAPIRRFQGNGLLWFAESIGFFLGGFSCGLGKSTGYPAWPFSSWIYPATKSWFSIAMLVYQRVYFLFFGATPFRWSFFIGLDIRRARWCSIASLALWGTAAGPTGRGGCSSNIWNESSEIEDYINQPKGGLPGLVTKLSDTCGLTIRSWDLPHPTCRF